GCYHCRYDAERRIRTDRAPDGRTPRLSRWRGAARPWRSTRKRGGPLTMSSADVRALTEYAGLFQCPSCRAALSTADEDCVTCARGHKFPVENGLPILFSEHEEYGSNDDVTDVVKSFYMENPFPNYEDTDSVGSLIDHAARSVFARALDREIPFGARVLEVGCGTGQLSLYLSLAKRQLFGV